MQNSFTEGTIAPSHVYSRFSTTTIDTTKVLRTWPVLHDNYGKKYFYPHGIKIEE